MHRFAWVALAVGVVGCGGQGLPADAERTAPFREVQIEKGVAAKIVSAGGYGYKFDERTPPEFVRDGDVLTVRNPDGRQIAEVTLYAEALTTVRLSGQSEVEMLEVSSERLEVRMSGQSSLVLAGISDVLDAELSGQAALNAQALDANSVLLRASGEASCTVTAQQALDASLSGNAVCAIAGDPEDRSVQTEGNAVVELE